MTTLEYNLQTLSAMLDKDPGNAETRLICADVLEEDGQVDLADTYRWMVEYECYPSYDYEERLWAWQTLIPVSRDHLPPGIFYRLPRNGDATTTHASPYWLHYSTPSSGEQALCHALKAAGEI